MDHTQLGTDNR